MAIVASEVEKRRYRESVLAATITGTGFMRMEEFFGALTIPAMRISCTYKV